MMRSLFFLFVALLVSPVSADIALSLNADGNSSPFDTGVAGAGKSLSLYIGETESANDSISVLVANFQISSGSVTSGVVGATGAGAPLGFFGAGNLSVSQFNIADKSVFNVNQELTNGMQPLLNSPSRERWFDFGFDTSGLSAGVYTVTLLNPGNVFRGPGNASLAVNGSVFSFSVSSIPEPGSASIFGVASLMLLVRRRR